MSKVPSERINELDFEVAKENFLSFVKNNSEFGDYDYEASGLNFLVDLLAYNTQYNAFYLNQLSSEMFLDTAQQRKNVVSIAKQMGYLANSKKASNAKVILSFSQVTAFQYIINMDTESKFVGKNQNGDTLPFITAKEYNFSESNNYSTEVTLIQGRYVEQSITVNQLQLEIDLTIASRDVDLDYLSVFVRENALANKRDKYERVEDISLLDKDSLVYYIEEDYDGYYKIMFGDGVIGKQIQNNNVIEMRYLVTSGASGNDFSVFEMQVDNGLPTKPSIQTSQFSAQGSDKEDVDQVRRNARKMYFSQNRTVTEKDYDILLRKHFPYIDSISVWGGEKNEIPMYGTVYCAIKPKGRNFLTDGEKETITRKLDTLNVISIVPKIVDPEYVYVSLDVDITFDIENIENTAREIISLVESEIIGFAQENLLRFDNSFQITALSRLIDQLNPHFIGTNTKINIYQTKKIITGVPNSYKINFNNRVRQGTFTATRFGYLDSNGNEIQNCMIRESRDYSKLEIHRVLDEEKDLTVSIVDNVGSIDYKKGLIRLENFSPTYIINSSSEIKFDIEIDSYIIRPTMNQILIITQKDISVSATGILTNS